MHVHFTTVISCLSSSSAALKSVCVVTQGCTCRTGQAWAMARVAESPQAQTTLVIFFFRVARWTFRAMTCSFISSVIPKTENTTYSIVHFPSPLWEMPPMVWHPKTCPVLPAGYLFLFRIQQLVLGSKKNLGKQKVFACRAAAFMGEISTCRNLPMWACNLLTAHKHVNSGDLWKSCQVCHQSLFS